MPIEQYLDRLKIMRDEWSNEIPSIMLHSNMEQSGMQPPKYKVRVAWFSGVIASSEILIRDGYASESSKKLFEDFMHYWKTDREIERPKIDEETPTIKEDIDKADELLTSLIEDLERQNAKSK